VKEFLIQRYRQNPSGPSARPTFLRVDDNGRIVQADHHAETLFGHTPSELIGEPVQRLLASRQDDPFAPSHRHRLNDGQSVLVTFRHKDGFFFTASLGLQTTTRDSDRAATAGIAFRDSADMDSRLLSLAERSSGFGLWELNIINNETSWSEGMYRLLELRAGTEITPEQALFYCQNRQNRVRALFRRCLRTGQPFSTELTLLTNRQALQQVTLAGRAVKQGNRIQKITGILINRSELAGSERHRQQTQQVLEAATGATPDLVVAVDTGFSLLHFNTAWASQFQAAFNLQPQAGDNLKTLLKAYPDEWRLIERLWQRAFDRDHFIAEMPLNREGEGLPVYEFHFKSIRGPGNEVLGAVHVAKDISNRLVYSSKGDYRMRHDPVTGLMNRRSFLEHLRRAMGHRHKRPVHDALLFLDLDGFERLTKTGSDGISDRYLRGLANTLGQRVRQRDALARLSGDSFAIFVENCPEPRARKIAEEIRQQISDFHFEWQGNQLHTTASGGLLLLDEEMPGHPEQLLAQAADLCATAKTSGCNCIQAAHALPGSAAGEDTNFILDRLHNALDNHNLILEFQAIKPLASVTWGDHIEVLSRIPGQTLQQPPLTPAQFLPVAERFNLSQRLDRQVIQQTLDWLELHPLLEPRLKYCGFNLSLATVLDGRFGEYVEQLVSKSNYPPECFCFEIRESYASEYTDEVGRLCDTLHRMGCRVALDGAGASVEGYQLAANLAVDIIKLDRRVMNHLEDDPVQQIMVDALHRIAEAAGKETVATFIESDKTLQKVRTLGIHFGQGYRLAEPQPLEALTPAAVELSTGRIGG